MTLLDTRPSRRAAPRRIEAAEPLPRGQVWTAESAAAVFDDFMAATPAVAFVKDSAGRYRYVNRQFLEQFGDHFGSDWFGKTDADVWPAGMAALFRASDVAALAADVPVQTTELVPIGEAYVPFLVTKFPIYTRQGVLLGGIGLDITAERALAVVAARHAQQRTLIADTLAHLPAQATSEATAQIICRQVVSLPGALSASIMRFAHDDRAWPMGFALADGGSPELRPIPYQRSRHLRERALEGAWIEAWIHRPWHPYNKTLNEVGVRAHVYAPIHHAGRLVGLLAVGSPSESAAVELAESVPALVEFAGLAGVLFGPDLAGRAEAGRGRDYILDVIGHRAFQPVFQPIVDLGLNTTVGYEALTRFTDGSNPEVMFTEAVVAGLGAELETATLGPALAAAEALPGSAWLNLNVSPEFIIAGEPLRTLLRRSRRRLVLEVTEHTAIADYPAFRAAMDALGPKVHLAVDDAGAGFASLRHILELRPAFVKLDRSLLAGLESDHARQAMIVGLRHFARATGCQLIAEGIETDHELAVLRDLDIRLGQGYLLGRPLSVATASNQVLLA